MIDQLDNQSYLNQINMHYVTDFKRSEPVLEEKNKTKQKLVDLTL